MFVKSSVDCEEVTANDGCQVRELLHPAKDPVDLQCSIALASVKAGGRSYRHRLRQTEVYYIISGQGCMHIDNESCSVRNGDVIYIPANAVQWIENSGEIKLEFAAIVSPPWNPDDDIRIPEQE